MSDPTPLGEPYGEINPNGLYRALKRLAAYGKPIYVTENGIPDHDDDARPSAIARHVAEAWKAIQDGADLRGYYYWTLVDNFEWAAGWSLRFGLYSLDTESSVRTPTRSAAVYARIAQANGISRAVLDRVAPAAVGDYFRD